MPQPHLTSDLACLSIMLKGTRGFQLPGVCSLLLIKETSNFQLAQHTAHSSPMPRTLRPPQKDTARSHSLPPPGASPLFFACCIKSCWRIEMGRGPGGKRWGGGFEVLQTRKWE